MENKFKKAAIIIDFLLCVSCNAELLYENDFIDCFFQKVPRNFGKG